MKALILLALCSSLSALTGCEAIASKTGMSGTDILFITADAANRARADYEAVFAQVKAARQRTAAKNPVNVNP